MISYLGHSDINLFVFMCYILIYLIIKKKVILKSISLFRYTIIHIFTYQRNIYVHTLSGLTHPIL
jgi:hypothetical protein